MLNINASRGLETQMLPLSDLVTKVEEATVLVATNEVGVGKVKPSAGGVPEMFAGLALNTVFDATVAPFVEEITVPATSPYVVNLLKTPLDDAYVGARTIVANGALIKDANGTLADGEWQRSGKAMTFHSAQAGLKVRVMYRYAPTVAELSAIYGQGIGDGAQSVIGATGVITSCEYVFTSLYDETDDWYNATGPIYMGAGGRLTLKPTNNSQVPRAYVYRAPLPSDPFLGIVIPK